MARIVLALILCCWLCDVSPKRRLQNIASGTWDAEPGIRNTFPSGRADLLRSYGLFSVKSSKVVESTDVWWRPDIPSLISPVLDAKGTCIALHHLVRNKALKTGTVLFIGDEISARASATLSAALNAHGTSPSCSYLGTCQHNVCGKESAVQVQFMSSKAFMKGACLTKGATSAQCSSADTLGTLAGADVVVFGLGHYLSTVYTQEGGARSEGEAAKVAQWMHETYAPAVNTSTLLVFQSIIPFDKFCDPRNQTDEALHHSFLRFVDTVDQHLYQQLQTGALAQHPHLKLTQMNIAGAVFAREELHRSNFVEFTEADRHNCELRSALSDSIMLLLSQLYGALLQHVTPAPFPPIVPFEVEDHGRAMQRVALHELNIINYLHAKMRLDDAVAHQGWHLPADTAVTLSITDIRYAEAIPYWYYSRRNYNVEGVIVAMDAATCDHLRTNFPTYLALCMHIPHTLTFAPPHKLNTIVATGKIIYPLLFMFEYNMSVIFSEMDIFWKGNPYPYLTHVSYCACGPSAKLVDVLRWVADSWDAMCGDICVRAMPVAVVRLSESV
jgi:hypothetical protein